MRRLLLVFMFAGIAAPVLAQQSAPPARPPQTVPPTAQQPSLPPPSQGRQTPPAPAPPSVQTPRPGQAPSLPGVQTPRGQQGQQGQGQAQLPTMAPSQSGTLSWQNIKLEIAIADSIIPDTPGRKTVSMLIADGRNGQVRGSGTTEGVINVDARPTLHRDGRIFLQLTIEYKPELPAQQSGNTRLTTFSESLALMLQDGVQVVASESSDPKSDRKVTVSLRATVQK